MREHAAAALVRLHGRPRQHRAAAQAARATATATAATATAGGGRVVAVAMVTLQPLQGYDQIVPDELHAFDLTLLPRQ